MESKSPLRRLVAALVLMTISFGNVESALLLSPRACTISCPTTDAGYYPLGDGSGLSGGLLTCTYPFLSHCSYSAVDGSLTKDRDSSLCRLSAQCTSSACTCPSTDLGQYPLGRGSVQFGSVLFCTYPTPSELSSTGDYCEYSITDGSQVLDNDSNLCPLVAARQGCDSLPTSTAPTTTTPTTSTSASSTSASQSSASAAAANSSATSIPSKSNSKRITAIAVGSTVGALALVGVVLLAWIFLRPKPKTFITTPPVSDVTSYGRGTSQMYSNPFSPPGSPPAFSRPPGSPHDSSSFPAFSTHSPPPMSASPASYQYGQPSYTDPSIFSNNSARPNLPEL